MCINIKMYVFNSGCNSVSCKQVYTKKRFQVKGVTQHFISEINIYNYNVQHLFIYLFIELILTV